MVVHRINNGIWGELMVGREESTMVYEELMVVHRES